MNNVSLTGRLTADPEMYGEGDKKVTKYRLAVDRRFNRGDQTADFIPIVTFGKSAEFAKKYFRKGMRVGVIGRIQTESYTKSDGTRVYTTDVIADSQEFLESKKGQEAPQQEQPHLPPTQEIPEDEFMSIPDGIDDQLPFH